MKFKKIGIIIADTDEFLPLTKKKAELNLKETVVAGRQAVNFNLGGALVTSVLCGIGKVNAAAAAAALCEQGYELLLNCGLSGGIDGVKREDITLPSRFLEHDFDLTGLGYAPCEKPGQEYIYNADEKVLEQLKGIFPNAVIGTAVSGDRFVSDDALRDSLKTNFSAVSCDMETAAIASVAYAYSTPFASVRKISDDAGNDAAGDYTSLNVLAEDVLINAILELIKKIS